MEHPTVKFTAGGKSDQDAPVPGVPASPSTNGEIYRWWKGWPGLLGDAAAATAARRLKASDSTSKPQRMIRFVYIVPVFDNVWRDRAVNI